MQVRDSKLHYISPTLAKPRYSPGCTGQEDGPAPRYPRHGSRYTASCKNRKGRLFQLKMPKRRALITGITGQDGSYLAELLLSKDYEVHGIVRRVAIEDPDHRLKRIQHLRGELILHAASLESYGSIHSVVEETQPAQCYHLAAQ